MARVVVERDPDWLDEDMDAALEWADWEASLCSGCRQDRSESFDPANQWGYWTEPLVCHACADRETLAKERSKEGVADMAGVYLVTHKRPPDDD